MSFALPSRYRNNLGQQDVATSTGGKSPPVYEDEEGEMSVMSPQQNSASFALQSRLFISMKRAGRVIDLVWLQQSPEYARAILSAADNMPDAEVRDLSLKLREILADYINQGATNQGSSTPSKVSVLPVTPRPIPVAAAPLTVAPEPVLTEEVVEHPELDRHLTSLR